MVFFSNILVSLTVTRNSLKNSVVLTAITILYITTLVSDILEWIKLPLLFGTSGQSRQQITVAEFVTGSGTDGVVQQLFGCLPFIVADGLLVRYPCCSFEFHLHLSIDMAVLQIME